MQEREKEENRMRKKGSVWHGKEKTKVRGTERNIMNMMANRVRRKGREWHGKERD